MPTEGLGQVCSGRTTNPDGSNGRPGYNTRHHTYPTINECVPGRKCLRVIATDQPMFCFVVRPYNPFARRHESTMSDLASDPGRLKKAIVQKLESLHRGGVRSFPRTEVQTPAIAPDRGAAQPAKQPAAPSAVKPTATPAKAATPTPTKAPVATQPPLLQVPENEPFAAPLVPAAERASALEIVSNDVAQCTRCSELASSRTQTVFGVGNPNARLVFFGEAPGADEDRMGEPFVGKAGQLLTKIIEACTLKREDVYIMNVLRCRPPGNRNPAPEEAQNCRPFFEKQFEIIRPEFICCLGSIAATTLLNTTVSVGRLRGKLHDWRGIKVAVTYHPAYLLRNVSAKKHVWADMKMLMTEMGIEL